MSRYIYRDRVEAGARLAGHLKPYAGRGVLVLGIPRGGVVVAAEVARALGADLDVVVARKLRAPGAPEFAIGAVAADGVGYLNQDVVRELEISADYLARETATQSTEARRRELRFRGEAHAPPVAGRIVIVVDDGLATGATMRAALRSLRGRGALRLIVAVPVGSKQAAAALRVDADEVACPELPEPFFAVGEHYQDFAQVEDDEVERLLRAWRLKAVAQA